ncbi:MAG TPA: hypothetical protein VKI44_20850 [Acetobacteraceae bacterium]|nr:hypothetical protein [Acetobacteraceae bacterium]
MSDEPPAPFFLIVTDHDCGVFAVEGSMTDDCPWQSAARAARDRQRRIACGPPGPNRYALAAEYSSTHKLTGAQPGSIMRRADDRAAARHRLRGRPP